MKIVIELAMPKQESKYPKAKSTEQQIREAIELVESGYESKVEWKMLNKAYRQLKGMKQTPRVKRLIKMIEPCLARHGQHGIPEK